MPTGTTHAGFGVRLRGFLADESGQSTTEYILIIGLISIPIYLAFNVVLKDFLHDFIAALIGSFTRG
jgi:Flp pilus assembly pilin Flp